MVSQRVRPNLATKQQLHELPFPSLSHSCPKALRLAYNEPYHSLVQCWEHKYDRSQSSQDFKKQSPGASAVALDRVDTRIPKPATKETKKQQNR